MSKQKLAFAICDYLSTSIQNGTIQGDSVEGIEVAIQCIGEAFGIDPSDAEQQKVHSIKPANLQSIFDIFVNTQKKVSEGKESNKETDVQANKIKAEEFKAQGNKQMSLKSFDEAIQLYTKAVELDGGNPIYYGNRAAAYSQLGKHQNSLADAQKALELDATYHKAYSRLGHAHFCLGNYEEAVAAYRQAVQADPNNANLKASLATAEQKLPKSSVTKGPASASASSARAPMGGMPDLGGMDIGSMMNNPGFMQMASQMMSNPAFSSMLQNPQVAEMAQNLMQDPSALQNLMANPEVAKMANDMMKK